MALPIETPALVDFKGRLTAAKTDGGKELEMVTARNVIDSTFRAIYRDARRVDRIRGARL